MNAEMLWLAFQAEGYTDITLEQLIAMDKQMHVWELGVKRRGYAFYIDEQGAMTRTKRPYGTANYWKCFENGQWVITPKMLECLRRRAKWWWGPSHGWH